MWSFVAVHPGAFLGAVFGVLLGIVGAGSLALGTGARLEPLLYAELFAYVAMAIAVAVRVRERIGGGIAVLLGVGAPLLTFFAWLEHRIAGDLIAGLTLAVAGALVTIVAIWSGHWDLNAAERLSAGIRRAFTRSVSTLSSLAETFLSRRHA